MPKSGRLQCALYRRARCLHSPASTRTWPSCAAEIAFDQKSMTVYSFEPTGLPVGGTVFGLREESDMTIDYTHPLPGGPLCQRCRARRAGVRPRQRCSDGLLARRHGPTRQADRLQALNASGLVRRMERHRLGGQATRPTFRRQVRRDITGSFVMADAGFRWVIRSISRMRPAGQTHHDDGGIWQRELLRALETMPVSAWTAGLKIASDGTLYDIKSGKALVTNDPAGNYLPITGGIPDRRPGYRDRIIGRA